MSTDPADGIQPPGALAVPILRLEYTCTPEEISEAESLALHQQLGGGSRWRTLAILLVVLAAMFWAMWRQILAPMEATNRYLVIVLFVAVWIFFFFRQRRRKRNAVGALLKVELSAAGIRGIVGEAYATTPWSAYGRVAETDRLLGLMPRSSGVPWFIPKRAIPSTAALDWLRDIPNHPDEVSDPPVDHTSVPPAPFTKVAESQEPITIDGAITIRDLLDMNLASWTGRGVMIAWSTLIVGVGIYEAFQPQPHAKFNELQMFLYFIIPFAIIGAAIQLAFITAHSWLTHRLTRTRGTIVLGGQSLTMTTKTGEATVPLSTYRFYKETRRQFILWGDNPLPWLLLPKHAFAPEEQITNCRNRLANALQRSTWFFGH